MTERHNGIKNKEDIESNTRNNKEVKRTKETQYRKQYREADRTQYTYEQEERESNALEKTREK